MLIEDILDMVGTCIYYIHDLLVPLLNMPIRAYIVKIRAYIVKITTL